MSARDRFVVLLTGGVLLAGGLLLVDWQARLVLDLPDTLDASPVVDATGTSWWPWAAAGVGVVLGLVGLAWLLSHLPRRGPATTRLVGSDQTGTLEVDVRALAGALASRLADAAPVSHVRGRTTRVRGRTVVELRARVREDAAAADLVDGVRRISAELDRSLGDDTTLRVLLGSPRRTRRTTDRIRVA